MIDRVDNNQPLAGASSMFSNKKRALTDNDLDVSINSDYSFLIEMAMKSSQTDSELIEKACELVRTGELESPQNFQKAAEKIITFGI
jgi:hypothetical protein